MLSRSSSPSRYLWLLWDSSLADIRWASSMITRSQVACLSPARMSSRLARSKEVMILVIIQPLVHSELVPDVVAPQDLELLVELLEHLPLPLEGEVGRAYNQDSLRESAEFEFSD